MAYTIGQYNKRVGIDDDQFLGPYTSNVPMPGNATTKKVKIDREVYGSWMPDFRNECVVVDALNTNKNYYFHGYIKRMNTVQTFQIKLAYIDETNYTEQYIKEIVVAAYENEEASVEDMWVEVEFIFTPLTNFNCILFELARVQEDYIKARVPIIVYEELSEIKNILNSKLFPVGANKLIRIGVQSRPSLMMCINGEEIRTSRTGVYELKNGIITVSFFSVVNAAKEGGDGVPLDQITASACRFNETKTRAIDSFTLDYLYNEKETQQEGGN